MSSGANVCLPVTIYQWVSCAHRFGGTLDVLLSLLPPAQKTDAILKLKKELAMVVVQDSKQWNSYNVKPLTFIHSPQSPFYPEMAKMVSANLDYLISTQKSDGGWGLTWSWEERNPTAWKLAEKEWLGIVALENLSRLNAFHRIERLRIIATHSTRLRFASPWHFGRANS